MNDDEVSYLDVPKKEVEKVWCKIGEAGDLEFVDWDMVRGIAESFDITKPENRTEQMLIGKLMWLVRQDALNGVDREQGE